MESQKRIVEINGVKIEVDLRTAKRVDVFRVGDTVKVLCKKYSDTYETYCGVITDFVEFQKLPSMEVLYVESDGSLRFKTINSETEDAEIAKASEHDFAYSKGHISMLMDSEINRKQKELNDAVAKKYAFDKFFGKLKMDEE